MDFKVEKFSIIWYNIVKHRGYIGKCINEIKYIFILIIKKLNYIIRLNIKVIAYEEIF